MGTGYLLGSTRPPPITTPSILSAILKRLLCVEWGCTASSHLAGESYRELEFEIRAKHARLRPHVMASAALRDCHLHQVSRPFHLPKTTGAMAIGSQHNTRAVVPQLTYATWTTV